MMKLFNKKDFAAIMKAVDPAPHGTGVSEPHFGNACNQAGLTPSETKWLKAYLSQCDQAVYGGTLEEAAASGW